MVEDFPRPEIDQDAPGAVPDDVHFAGVLKGPQVIRDLSRLGCGLKPRGSFGRFRGGARARLRRQRHRRGLQKVPPGLRHMRPW